MPKSKYSKLLLSLGFVKYDLEASARHARIVKIELEPGATPSPPQDDGKVVPMLGPNEPCFIVARIGDKFVMFAFDEHRQAWKRVGDDIVDLKPHGFTDMFERVSNN